MMTSSDAETLRSRLVDFREAISAYVTTYGNDWTPTSKAATERNGFPKPNLVTAMQCLGTTAIQVSADLLLALTKTLVNPVQTIAPWTCIRSMIESGSLACWLLDPAIDVKTRVQRGFAWQYEQLDQELKYARCTSQPVGEIELSIKELEAMAQALGYPKVTDKNGKRAGIGQRMPSFTEIVKMVLESESSYRLSSAFIHGHSWALVMLSQRVASEHCISPDLDAERGVVHMINDIDPRNIALLIQLAVLVFAKPIWYQCFLFGWDSAQLASILQRWADSLDLPAEGRFWNQGKQSGVGG